MLLYLVRHGETELNALGVYQGHLATPLNTQGRQQALKLSKALRHVGFKECWTSPLARASETANIVLGPYHPRISIQLEPLLTDRAMGALQGKPWTTDPAAHDETVESDEALATRLHTFLDQLIQVHTPLSSPAGSPLSPVSLSAADAGADAVLIVTHAECLATLLRILTCGTDIDATTDGCPRTQDQRVAPDPAADMGLSGAPPTPTSPVSPGSRRLVDTRVPATVNLSLLCANTAVCVVRVWWEETASPRGEAAWPTKLEAKGRVESWGDVAHLG